MDTERKAIYKQRFEEFLNSIIKDLKECISSENGDWTIKGFIDIYKNIYTISSDTKIISKILEIHIFPEILRYANKFGYKIVLAEKQNWYPDLTFICDDDENIKFALDLKTTFRRKNKISGFTLGSHGSYFQKREGTKNIQFPYNQYSGHYCLGIIYSQNDNKDDLCDTEIFKTNELQDKYDKNDPIKERQITEVSNLKSITSVIKDFDFFVAEKWKIACDSQGSGNTANIGSITDIENLKAGNGVFSKLGEEWFDDYWINYGQLKIVKNEKVKSITNIWDFLRYKGREDLFPYVGGGAKKDK